jgi:enoyl-CoA hydratase
MGEGCTRYQVKDGVATVLFDRPEARNAMTFAMYDGLAQACENIATDPEVRVAVFRGVGGEAFIAGTDIQQFTAFKDAEDGITYERRIDALIEKLEGLAKPTIAVTEGWTTGGGLVIAASCDFRIAIPTARYGAPIARTLGNCLSIVNVARLITHFGPARTRRILLLADMIDADEALACGFVEAVVEKDALDEKVAAYCDKLKSHAPLTIRAAKEAVRRLTLAGVPVADDLIRSCYGSADFKEGVESFLAKRKPVWRGR